jgi:hypothetical protein
MQKETIHLNNSNKIMTYKPTDDAFIVTSFSLNSIKYLLATYYDMYKKDLLDSNSSKLLLNEVEILVKDIINLVDKNIKEQKKLK